MEGIKHHTTKVRSPRTNGFVERMNRTLLDECFRVQGRTKWYTSPDEIQGDLDTFMASTTSGARTKATGSLAGRPPRPSSTLSPRAGSYRPFHRAPRGGGDQLIPHKPRGPGVEEKLDLYNTYR